jgi:hypothetical protein
VAGQRRLDRDLRRLLVTDLAEEDDVGVGSQDRAEAAANVMPALVFTWTWLIPGIRYSTGSSTVITLTVGFEIVASVV